MHLNRQFIKNFKRKSKPPKKEYGSGPDAYGGRKRLEDSLKLDRTFKKIPIAKYGRNDDTVEPNVHSESNPLNREPQHELNRFIIEYVIPDYGGTIEGWKQILNEIAYHESGPQQRFDSAANQLGTLKEERKGKSFAQMEMNSAKTNMIRLFSSETDAAGNFVQRYEQFFDKYIKDQNSQFRNEEGDTITHSPFPELEKLYMSMVDVKLNEEGGTKGWKGGAQPFDVRQVSDQSIGILMLLELMGNYEKQDNPDLKLSQYFEGDNLASPRIRTQLWGEYYNTDSGFLKDRKFMRHLKEFNEDYQDHKGVVTKWSWPDGYGGDVDKQTPVINYAPFYSHELDFQDTDQITKNLKSTFEQYYGKTLDGKTFKQITTPQFESLPMDKTYVHPRTNINIDNINRYNKPEKIE